MIFTIFNVDRVETQMKRIFIALPIPEKIATTIIPLQNGIEGARFSPRENFHITLRFLGDMHEPDIEDLDNAIGEIKFAPFDLSLSGIDFFGRTEPHSIHAKVVENAQLNALQEKVDTICTRLGFKKDHLKFVPHLTLAYLKSGTQLQSVIDYQTRNALFKSKVWRADRFNLYSSAIGKGPSIYEDLAQYPLV